ncbi:hypothetical protein MJ575_11095 [Klebsiella pneumoniae]|nr:hypothetical protein MJ575_11095 [Klebsiella pneumoniae]
MSECRMGQLGRLTTDIGPVIDAEGKRISNAIFRRGSAKGAAPSTRRCARIKEDARNYVSRELSKGRGRLSSSSTASTELKKEVFGPVPYVRYNRNELDKTGRAD